jgi:hypothetical protein
MWTKHYGNHPSCGASATTVDKRQGVEHSPWWPAWLAKEYPYGKALQPEPQQARHLAGIAELPLSDNVSRTRQKICWLQKTKSYLGGSAPAGQGLASDA